MARRSPLLAYVKAAFVWRWNLLAVGTGAIFSFLTRKPDMFLPLVAAVEVAFLGLLSTHPRFRKAVDARARGGEFEADADALIKRIRTSLHPEAWMRFEVLRDRCRSLKSLAQQFQGPHAAADPAFSEMQTSSLDRLLWMFLKLLYSQDALERFLRTTDRNALTREIASTEKTLEQAREQKRDERLIRALEDKMVTLKQRLANYDRARENRDLLVIEIDRIEQKVNAISEMAMSSRDAGDIGAQVDGIAAGVQATEEAIRELDVAPIFPREEAPKLLAEEE